MAHSALLCVVHAKLLSTSTWGETAALMAAEGNILPCHKKRKNLKRGTEKKERARESLVHMNI